MTAQTPRLRFDHLDTEDGLSQQTVHAIFQDRSGYIWLGTQDGLNRWDGNRFKIYRKRSGDPFSISDNRIRAMVQDQEGRIWLGTDVGGIDALTPETGLVERFAAGSPEWSLDLGLIRTMEWRNEHELWVGSNENLTLIDTRSRRLRLLDSGRFQDLRLVQDLAQSTDGNLWIAHEKGLSRLDPELENLETVPLPGGAEQRVVALAWGPESYLWAGTKRQVFQLSPSGKALRTLSVGDESTGRIEIMDVRFDRGRRMWVSTSNGLYLLPPGESSFHTYRKNLAAPHDLADDEIPHIYEDRTGMVWFGTLAAGVARWHPSTLSFGHYPSTDVLEDGSTYAFGATLDGDLWIGTRSGALLRLRRGVESFERFSLTALDPIFKNIRVMCLLGDRKGRLWIGTRRSGLIRFDPATRSFERYVHDPERPDSLSSSAIMTIFESESGLIFVGTAGGGLAQFQPTDEAFLRLTSEAEGSLPSSDNISGISDAEPGGLWLLALNHGLHHLRLETGELTHFQHAPADPSSLAGDSVACLHKDQESRLWVGTLSAGFSRLESLDLDTGRASFRSWNESHGLPNNTVYGVLSDDDGRIWLSTNRGLSRFDPITETFTNFEPRHGLQGWEYNFGAYMRGPDGDLFFGGTNGFNRVRPGEVDIRLPPPPIALSHLEVSNQPVPVPRALSTDASIQLSYEDTSLSLSVAALDFWAPDQNRYAYRLEGFDKDWIHLDENRPIVYTNLDPGNYTFRAKASNSEGVWNEAGLTIPVRVAYAPWETWWAWCLYLTVGAGLVYSGVRWRLAALERRSEELKELVDLRTAELKETVDRLLDSEASALEAKRRALKSLEEALGERRKAQEADQAKSIFLSNMSHELRTPLNAVLGFAQLMERDPQLTAEHQESLKVILRSGEHLLSLINDVLSLAKIEAGRLTLSHEPFLLHRACRDVEGMVRPKAQEKSLRLEVAIADDVPEAVIGDAGRLVQVLLNLMGNAVKFTHEGGVRLDVTTKAHLVEMVVSDTGVGIPEDELNALFEPFQQTEAGVAEKEGTGLGLAISERLVELMGGTLRVDSKVGEGSTFAFALPLQAAPVDQVVDGPRRVVAIGLGQKPPKILVADDAGENRHLLRRLFEDVGLPVRTAKDGREAVETWRQWRPSLIWMDMRMPIMDGYEATREIRRAEAELVTGRTAIVALTAAAFEDDRREILAAGCDDVVTKPYQEHLLFEKMAHHLDLTFVYGEPGQGPASHPANAAPESSEPQPEAEPEPERRVLIAEDNPSNQMVARRMLERLGYRADVVPDGSEVLPAFSRYRYPLVLMDIRMPRMDGIEAGRRLRSELPSEAQPAIIALTGLASEDERRLCLEAGMDDLLAKPFRIEDLQAMLDRWLPADGERPPSRARVVRRAEEPVSAALDVAALDRRKLELLRQLDEAGGSRSLASQVISLFLDTVPGQVKELQRAIADGDLLRWRRVAHSLKNSSSTLGAEEVSAACAQLEQLAGSSENVAEVQRRAQPVLERLLRQVEAALRALSQERDRTEGDTALGLAEGPAR